MWPWSNVPIHKTDTGGRRATATRLSLARPRVMATREFVKSFYLLLTYILVYICRPFNFIRPQNKTKIVLFFSLCALPWMHDHIIRCSRCWRLLLNLYYSRFLYAVLRSGTSLICVGAGTKQGREGRIVNHFFVGKKKTTKILFQIEMSQQWYFFPTPCVQLLCAYIYKYG
jgi:hypothetical protein